MCGSLRGSRQTEGCRGGILGHPRSAERYPTRDSPEAAQHVSLASAAAFPSSQRWDHLFSPRSIAKCNHRPWRSLIIDEKDKQTAALRLEIAKFHNWLAVSYYRPSLGVGKLETWVGVVFLNVWECVCGVWWAASDLIYWRNTAVNNGCDGYFWNWLQHQRTVECN